MSTPIQLSAELLAEWAGNAEVAVEAESILFWAAFELLHKDRFTAQDQEAVRTLLSAARSVSTPSRIFSYLLSAEARIAFSVAQRLAEVRQ